MQAAPLRRAAAIGRANPVARAAVAGDAESKAGSVPAPLKCPPGVNQTKSRLAAIDRGGGADRKLVVGSCSVHPAAFLHMPFEVTCTAYHYGLERIARRTVRCRDGPTRAAPPGLTHVTVMRRSDIQLNPRDQVVV